MPLLRADGSSAAIINQRQERFFRRYGLAGTTMEAPIYIPSDEEEAYASDATMRESEEEDEDAVGFDLGGFAALRISSEPVLPAGRAIEYRVNGMVVKPGDMLEIKQLEERYQSCFLRVIRTYSIGGQVKVQGIPYARLRNTLGLLEWGRNELVEVVYLNDDDGRPLHVQGAVEVSADDIICKRDYQFTNADWPEFGCEVWKDFAGQRRAAEELGMLTVRWRMLSYYNRGTRAQQRVKGMGLLRLGAHEVPAAGLKVPEDVKLNRWRGTKVRGGSYGPNSAHHGAIEVDGNPEPHATSLKEGQKYTFGDIFSGAGGASRGAQAAGFQVALACDNDPSACQSYHRNFPDANAWLADVHDFIVSLESHEIRVDVLHVSPPCQVWSPVHTTPGRNDDLNRDILSSVAEIIKKLRPRIATLEQTFGITFQRHTPFFNSLLQSFTSQGYSVTWRCVDLSTWGVPQPRKRVVMIASCPGEAHPTFPGPSGIPVSVNAALDTIHHGATYHNPHALWNKPGFPKPPLNGNLPLRRTILTRNADGDYYHPSGRRPFTVREFASLQTFPSCHEFVGTTTEISRQIGNAFPPAAVEYLYRHLRTHLLAVDGIVEELD